MWREVMVWGRTPWGKSWKRWTVRRESEWKGDQSEVLNMFGSAEFPTQFSEAAVCSSRRKVSRENLEVRGG